MGGRIMKTMKQEQMEVVHDLVYDKAMRNYFKSNVTGKDIPVKLTSTEMIEIKKLMDLDDGEIVTFTVEVK